MSSVLIKDRSSNILLGMERRIDTEIEKLKKQIQVMGGYVEASLAAATAALVGRDQKKFLEVHDIEKKINEEHIQLDLDCVELLAKQSPVAKDLRLIVSIIKINSDLERMGDQTVNIAYTGRDYLGRAPLDQLKLITKMSTLVRNMVRESLDCFVREDVELAKKILLIDDEVDELKNQVNRELTQYMRENSLAVESGLDLILIARNLERLGDHATNIAEDVIFVSTGRDIRHGGQLS